MLGNRCSRFVVRLASVAEFGRIVARDACVVNEKVNAIRFFRGNFICEADTLCFAGDVTWEGDDFARTGGVLLNDFAEGFLTTAGDIDNSTVGAQGLGYHQADTCATASYNSFQIGHIEQLGVLQVFVGEMGGRHAAEGKSVW